MISSAPDSRFRLELVDRFEGLDAHAAAWDELTAASPLGRPMVSHAWVRTHLEHRLAPEQPWRVAFAFQEDRLVGVLPVVVAGKAWARTLHSIVDDHCPSGDAVVDGAHAEAVLPALMQAQKDAEPRAVSLTLHGVVDASPTYQHRAPGTLATRVMEGAALDVTGDFDACFAALSRNSRSKLRRAARALEKEAPLRMQVLDGTATDALDRFCALEAAGWKGRRGTAISDDAALLAYYRALTDRLTDRGWMRWHFLEHGDRTIAAEMIVECGEALVVHKVAFDEDYAKHSPGNLLWARSVEYACGRSDIRHVDLLADCQLMQRWGAQPYVYHDLVSVGGSLRARLFARWPHRARQIARQLRDRAASV